MTAPEITVYGKPACPGCAMTTKRLDALGVPYTYRDITTDPAAYDTVRMLGYQAVPVVVAGDIHFGGGFRNNELKQLASTFHTAPDITALERAAEKYLMGEDAA
ncbi:glutaredoxin family protein [Nocardia farcinica]|uniref:glutaredoxin family protein n=1 Tax=Nocardia farcinica TaxID=37329 RepID=UPI001895F311|nr:glutaredoxin family protein [Nocardia farcinica]MBF6394045.1 glutaredoxin family protein [Nocardia farcinica]